MLIFYVLPLNVRNYDDNNRAPCHKYCHKSAIQSKLIIATYVNVFYWWKYINIYNQMFLEMSKIYSWQTSDVLSTSSL